MATIQPGRAIGCVVEPACEVSAPGVIVHHDLNRFIIGEPDGSRSSRVLKLSEVLTQVATPIIDAVLALVQARAAGAGLYARLGTSR